MIEIPSTIIVCVLLLVGFLAGLLARRVDRDLVEFYEGNVRRAIEKAYNLEDKMEEALDLYRACKKERDWLRHRLRETGRKLYEARKAHREAVNHD